MRQHAPRSAPRCRMRRRFMPFTARWGRISPPANGRTMRRWGRSVKARLEQAWPDSLADGQQLIKDDRRRATTLQAMPPVKRSLMFPEPLAHQPDRALLGSPARAVRQRRAISVAPTPDGRAGLRTEMAYRGHNPPLHPAAADPGADGGRHLVHENHPALPGLGASSTRRT